MNEYGSRRVLPVHSALAAAHAVSAVLVFGLWGGVLAAQAPRPGDAAPAQTAQPPIADGADPPAGSFGKPAVSTARVFASESGLILSPVKATKVLDFELVVARIHEALATSADPVRRQQAAGWKVYRATEPGPGGSVVFVFLMSPAVKGADYTVGKILMEAFPQDEVLEIFDLYSNCFAGPQSLLSLRLLDDFGEPARPRALQPK